MATNRLAKILSVLLAPIGRMRHDGDNPIRRKLLQSYNVSVVEKDEQNRLMPLGDRPTEKKLTWEEDIWTEEELNILWDTIELMSSKIGGKARFRTELGSVTIWKDAALTTLGSAQRPNIRFWTKSPLTRWAPPPSSRFTEWTLVHELAHLWDQGKKGALADGLMRYTGGYYLSDREKQPYWTGICHATINSDGVDFHGNDWRPGCNNAGYVYGGVPPKGAGRKFTKGEDWAESVAAYIFPEIVEKVIEKYKGSTTKGHFYYPDYQATERWKYVDGVVMGTLP